ISSPNVLSGRRFAALMSGAFSLWVAVGSPLAALDHQLLTAHMMQHLLLMTVAAPLILLGTPLAWLGSLRFAPARRFGRFVTHPVFCWLASTGVVIGWHVPALFALGMHSERWHEVEQASFLLAGLLFWIPVVR